MSYASPLKAIFVVEPVVIVVVELTRRPMNAGCNGLRTMPFTSVMMCAVVP